MRRALPLLLLLLSSAGCQPAFERRPSRIDAARILAVQSSPAEARPGAPVSLRVLRVDPNGTVSAAVASWAFCVAPRPAADYNTISSACLGEDPAVLRQVPPGADPSSAMGPLPPEGCSVFGSEPLPPKPGEPPVRAADPDPTGGYYQPVRVRSGDGGPVAFGQVRLSCALAQAPASAVFEYRDRYRRNENPALSDLASSAGLTIARGATVSLSASATPEQLEAYVVYDLRSARIEDRVETLTVAWFGTSGVFAADSTAMGDTGASAVEWTAPGEAGTVHVWAVLRDDRGGIDWRQLTLTVQ